MKRFTGQPVVAAESERKYHAFQLSIDVAVPVDGELDSYDFETLVLDLLENESAQTNQFAVLGTGVEDMDHAYDDKDIAKISNDL